VDWPKGEFSKGVFGCEKKLRREKSSRFEVLFGLKE
jgi:hypothetical protein